MYIETLSHIETEVAFSVILSEPPRLRLCESHGTVKTLCTVNTLCSDNALLIHSVLLMYSEYTVYCVQ